MSSEILRSIIERILSRKSDQDDIGEDIRDIYAEAHSLGMDKTALGQLVTYLRKRSKDGNALAVREAKFEEYLSEYDSGPRARTRTRGGNNDPGEAADGNDTQHPGVGVASGSVGSGARGKNCKHGRPDPEQAAPGQETKEIPRQAEAAAANGNGAHDGGTSGGAELAEPDIPLGLIRDPSLREHEAARRGRAA